MGEFSVKELEIIEYLVDGINSCIFSIEEEERDQGKLDYSLCSDNDEKKKITEKKLRKFKLKIKKSNPKIAAYLFELTKPTPSEIDFYDYRDKFTRTFIVNEYSELIEDFLFDNIEELKKYQFAKHIKSRGFDFGLINDYIQGVCSVNIYTNYKLFLDSEINANQEISKPNTLEIKETMIFNENLINDPLFSPENEYMTLKEAFKEDCISRTAHLNGPYDFFVQEFDGDLQEWENTQKEEINKTFLKLIKELNHKKIFFFGCTFDNYKHNYDKRLNEFLEYYFDANEYDFIEDELKFLENILLDIQNPEAAHDGHSQSGYDVFSKAYEFVSITGYKQYFFSHNKKEAFLNEKKYEPKEEKIVESVSIDNHQNEVEQEKPKKFEIKSKLLKKQLKFLNRNEEVEKYQKEIWGIEKKEGNEDEEDNNQNDLLKSTIDDYLEEFKESINGDGYEKLVGALFQYFTNGTFPVLEGKIKFKKINKKRVGWALKELYKSEKTDNLEIEYFRFAQENINLFEKEVIVMENFNKSNFYKAFTSNPAK